MMKRIILNLLLLACILPLSAQKAGSGAEVLSARLDTLIKHKLPPGSNVAIAMYDLTAGKPLYNYQADKLSRPASTMKLLTTITALSRPEADEPFRTEVWYKGVIERDTLRGDLYVKGGYDPEFDDEALDSLVNAVARLPFSVIQGRVYGDVSMKDSLYWGSGWAWDDTPYSYQPYLSPLMLNKGVVSVTATAGTTGDTARLACKPASTYYTLTNRTKTRTPSAGRFRVSRNWLTNGNNIIVTGNVDGRRSGTVNIYSSQDFFMHTFVERLQARGIRCIEKEEKNTEEYAGVLAAVNTETSAQTETDVWTENNTRIKADIKTDADANKEAETNKEADAMTETDTYPDTKPEKSLSYSFAEFLPDSLSVLITAYETSVQDVVKEIMKESDNLNAEAMLCRLGAQSTGKKHISAADGLSAIRKLIKQLGHNPDRYNLADGCGLSNYNYISPELLVSFLRHAYSRTDVFRKLYKALPIGGVDGTLEYRMKKGTPSHQNVHAKTGSFTAINCLAGYLKAGNGHEIAFAIMNQNVLSGREARAFQDAVCDEVIRGK